MDLWKKLETGPKVPEVINAVIEIPAGCRNKYEFGKSGEDTYLKLDRVLASSVAYPLNYGIVPQTWWEDNDPLDIMVFMQEPVYPGTVIEVRPIAVMKMIDGGDKDDKILAVPVKDKFFADVKDLKDVSKAKLDEIAEFFRTYKALEGKKTEILGWFGAEDAKKAVLHGVKLFKGKFSAKE